MTGVPQLACLVVIYIKPNNVDIFCVKLQLTSNFYEEFTSGFISSPVAGLVHDLISAPGEKNTWVSVTRDKELHRGLIIIVLEHRILPGDTDRIFIGLSFDVLWTRGHTGTFFICRSKIKERAGLHGINTLKSDDFPVIILLENAEQLV